MSDLNEAFCKFIKDNNLDERHNVAQVFHYDYVKRETDFDKLELDNVYEDDFYLDGMALYRAFKAGYNFGENK